MKLVLASNNAKKLKELQALIRKEAPNATETIRYGIAAFHLNGPLVYIGGFKDHVSFFPTGSAVRAFRKDLAHYKTSAGTIQFELNDPLPSELIRKILRFRLSEVRTKKSSRPNRSGSGKGAPARETGR